MASELTPSGDEFLVTEQPEAIPVVNFLCNDEYGLLISDALGGYSFNSTGQLLTKIGDAQTVADRPGRIIYLRDHDTNEYWSLTPNGPGILEPSRRFLARHGLGYSVFETEASGVGVTARAFVPPSDPVELWELKITNLRKSKRRLSLFLVTEWANEFDFCRAVGDSLMVTSRHQPELAGFIGFDHTLDSFETDPLKFFGRGGGYARPQALDDGGKLGRSQGQMTTGGLAVIEKKLALSAGATFELGAVIGLVAAARPAEKARNLAKHWAVAAHRRTAFEALVANWKELAARHLVKSPDHELNNRYNQLATYQGHLANRWPNAKSYGQDSVFQLLTTHQVADQIILGLLDAPALAKSRLTQMLERQLKDGGLAEVWPAEPSPELRSSSEATISLLAAATAFINETGELDWLKTHHPFLDGGGGSALEHLNRAVRFLEESLTGRHLLDTEAESILVTGKFIAALGGLAPILEAAGDHQQAHHLLGLVEKLQTAVNAQWAGGSYPRQISPTRVGLRGSKYHQLDLQTQLWAIISRVAEPKRSIKLLAAVKKLLATRHGLVDFAPPYANVENDNPLSFDQPGTGRNGAISTSHNLLYASVLATIGDGDGLLKLLVTDGFWLPDVTSITGETTVDFSSPVALHWQKVVLESLAGVTTTVNGLKINPCLPRDWRLLEINRLFRGAEYHIRIHNPLRVCRGVERIIVDGSRLTGTVIRPFRSGSHIVEVFLG